VLSLYSLSFLLTTIYYINASMIDQRAVARAASDTAVLVRYIGCECLPLAVLMGFQYRNHKIIIREWR
jgi:uncharacterized membrane protein